jgi:hypothetical protein
VNVTIDDESGCGGAGGDDGRNQKKKKNRFSAKTRQKLAECN